MASYNLVLDTKFKPFSYQEMLAPVLAATQAHQAIEEEYGTLQTKASVWEEMANEQTDPYAYKMYKRYSDDLEMKAEQLAREGLTPSSRKGMFDMRNRYSKEIVPIETAYKRREALAEEQRKAMAQNPTLRYQRMARTMSLDDLIKDPTLDYGESYSGALLTQQVSQAAANFKMALTDKGKLQKLGLPYQYERMIQYGATPAQVMEAMSVDAQRGDSDAVRFLRGITDQVLQSSGVADWANEATMREFRAFANQGLYSAIGQAKIDNFTDQYSMQDALNARQHARQIAAQQEAARQAKTKMYNIGATSLYGTSEVSAKNQDTLNLLNKFKKKGYFNSKGLLTRAGIKALQGATYKENYQRGPTGYIETKTKVGDWEFKNWALKNGQTQANIDAGTANMALNQYFQNTMAAINNGQLVTGTPNIDVYRQSIRDTTTQTYILNKTTAALAGGKIYKVGNITVGKNGTTTMSRGEGVSAADFKKLAETNPILHIINSPMTNNQLIELSDGTKFIMPKGMLDNVSERALNLVGDHNHPENGMGLNQQLLYAASPEEGATILNRANSYLGTLLNYNEGTGVSTNDGTITF